MRAIIHRASLNARHNWNENITCLFVYLFAYHLLVTSNNANRHTHWKVKPKFINLFCKLEEEKRWIQPTDVKNIIRNLFCLDVCIVNCSAITIFSKIKGNFRWQHIPIFWLNFVIFFCFTEKHTKSICGHFCSDYNGANIDFVGTVAGCEHTG